MLTGPTDVMVKQTGIDRVEISWNTSNTQSLDSEYHIFINSSNSNATTTLNATSPPLEASLLPSQYTMQLLTLSENLIYDIPSPVDFIVQGNYRFNYGQ